MRHLCFLLLLALCLPVTAHATLIEPSSFDELAESATVIAYGEVTALRSRWTDDGHMIITELEFRVLEPVLGTREGELLSFFTLGGSVGKLAQFAAGEASFALGEKAVVFLELRGGKLGVVGLGQGQWTSSWDEQAQCTMATPRIEGLSFVRTEKETEPSADGRLRSRVLELHGESALKPMPLDDLLATLGQLVDQR